MHATQLTSPKALKSFALTGVAHCLWLPKKSWETHAIIYSLIFCYALFLVERSGEFCLAAIADRYG